MQRTIRLGTRGSPLALAQTHIVRDKLAAAHGVDGSELETVFPIEVIKTTGDQIQDRPLNAIGGKGLFTKELEVAMSEGRIDAAVHSMKDMPTVLPDGLTLPCVLEREDPHDAFLSPKASTVLDLPEGAVVGSTSLRRQAQILARRPDLKVITYRGSVNTRLANLKAGEVDATILALAGLRRIQLESEITSVIDDDFMLPAVGQGAIAIEMRVDDSDIRDLFAPLSDKPSLLAVTAERAFLAELDGSCRTPIAGFGQFDGTRLNFRGRVLLPDGTACFDVEDGTDIEMVDESVQFGAEIGQRLKAKAGVEFFAKLAAQIETG